jgi:hypothetical protein
MFRVLRAKGKTLSSGGFGVAIAAENSVEAPKEGEEQDERASEHTSSGATTADDDDDDEEGGESVKPPSSSKKHTTFEYLFIEEVIFLHERGLLECLPMENSSVALDSSQLYQLLPTMGMNLPMYFVYSHLRSQDFRVLRHSPDRLDCLLQQQQQQDGSVATTTRSQVTALRYRVRQSIQHAPTPIIPDSGVAICWDAYLPNSKFGKTHPGLPDFYVAVTFYNQAQASFSDIQSLVLEKCRGIPLRLATVSDSGTVVMFGVTNFGVPPMAK